MKIVKQSTLIRILFILFIILFILLSYEQLVYEKTETNYNNDSYSYSYDIESNAGIILKLFN